MNPFKKLILTAVAAMTLCSLPTAAQSPMTAYSRYGYGILRDNATSAQRSMGGVGYAMSNGRTVNVMNPASYAATDSLTFLFDMGLSLTKEWRYETLSDGTRNSGNEIGGGLDYITMQFPIGKRFGAAIGLLPYSSVGYSFGSKITDGVVSRTGSGGLNQLFVGFAGNVYKGLNVGLNVGYLFGTTTNSTYSVSTVNASSSMFQTVTEVRDYMLQFGVQYTLPINQKNSLTFGATVTPGHSLSGHAYGLKYDANTDTSPDTIGYDKMKGRYSLPTQYGVGICWTWNERLMAEADFTYQPWKKAKYAVVTDENATMQFNDRWKAAVGLQYVPRLRGNWIQRVNYRGGAFYENSYLCVRGNKVREYGASLGFGLPAPGSKTLLNLGIEWRHRQGKPNSLVSENYMTITLGINFNERWFFKSKIY